MPQIPGPCVIRWQWGCKACSCFAAVYGRCQFSKHGFLRLTWSHLLLPPFLRTDFHRKWKRCSSARARPLPFLRWLSTFFTHSSHWLLIHFCKRISKKKRREQKKSFKQKEEGWGCWFLITHLPSSSSIPFHFEVYCPYIIGYLTISNRSRPN